MERCELIERSIIKKYRKSIWNNFIGALKEYRMISAGDRIAVCISGGKDSMLMAKLLQELQRHTEQPFELVFVVMDPGYNPENRQKIMDNAALLHIPITIFDSDIFAFPAGPPDRRRMVCRHTTRQQRLCFHHARTPARLCQGHHRAFVLDIGLFRP